MMADGRSGLMMYAYGDFLCDTAKCQHGLCVLFMVMLTMHVHSNNGTRVLKNTAGLVDRQWFIRTQAMCSLSNVQGDEMEARSL